MPLAHPQSITATGNYDEPCVAIAFATARPGEDVDDFKHRLSVSNEYSRTSGLELVLDREAATALVKMLVPVVGTYVLGDVGFSVPMPVPPLHSQPKRVKQFAQFQARGLER